MHASEDHEVDDHEVSQQGGADLARSMLDKHYDPVARVWRIAQVGDLWDAVRVAHELERFGEGVTIAVIDDGFDMSLPALAEHQLAWPAADVERDAHGSVVALLVLAVAPRATLRLYPCAVAGKWDKSRLVDAMGDAARHGADIINLSAGAPVSRDDLIDHDRPSILKGEEVWDDLSGDYLSFYTNLRMSELDGWRDVLNPPSTDLGRAATAATTLGTTVIAATGNQAWDVFTPAAEKTVYSVGFRSEHRVLPPDELLELAFSGKPENYEQSVWGCDFEVRQPPGVLGSSFATPLVSGLAALMVERRDLDAYRKVKFLASLAADGFALLEANEPWDDHRHGVMKHIFEKAVRHLPHRHYLPDQRYTCPECAVFAIDTYVNYGLLLMSTGDLDGAQGLLEAACVVAPLHAPAFANLGVLLGHRAGLARRDEDWREVAALLNAAQQACLRAVLLRPDYKPFKTRYDEYLIGSIDPVNWMPVP